MARRVVKGSQCGQALESPVGRCGNGRLGRRLDGAPCPRSPGRGETHYRRSMQKGKHFYRQRCHARVAATKSRPALLGDHPRSTLGPMYAAQAPTVDPRSPSGA